MYLKRIDKIGMLDLGEISFDDPIEVSIGITQLSNDLLAEIIGGIEHCIQQGCLEWEVIKERTGHTWGKVNVDPSLLIRLFPSGAIEYHVTAFFQDEEHEELFDAVYIDVDIQEHEEELRACLILGLINKFYHREILTMPESNEKGVKIFK